MGVLGAIIGTIEVIITCANPGELLSRIASCGIHVFNTRYIDDLTLQLTVNRQDWSRLNDIIMKRGGQCKIIRKRGLYWPICKLSNRPVLIVTLCFLLFLTCFVPSRVFFLRIEGNERISREDILSTAQCCGLGFGVKRSQVRNEDVKNSMLQKLESLQWVGVNTYGCVAVVSVKEKPVVDTKEQSEAVRSIVAVQDGVIRDMTVKKGNALCRVGEAVRKGQVLVSGYTDCTFCTRAEAADAEVYGQTSRQVDAVMLLRTVKRGEKLKKYGSYQLLFGKNLINLWKDSGISEGSCVKIKKEYMLTLPGGFQLPVALRVSTVTHYEAYQDRQSPETVSACIQSAARNYLLEQTVSGSILDETVSYREDDDALYLCGEYACSEMIGKIKYEEILTGNEKRD